MRTGTIVIVLVILILLAGGAYFIWHTSPSPAPGAATTTPQTTSTAQTVMTPAGLSFMYDQPYGLATTPEQVLVKSYIPSCAQGFDYCLYRTGSEFANTNFESAGVAIKLRTDLKDKQSCLTTAPMGYQGKIATTTEGSGYASSVSAKLGDAATGHYSSGYEYRLWYGTGTCYQFDTQIGETQIANYPAGTKTEFTAADRDRVMSELRSILDAMTVNGQKVSFPQA